MPAGWPLDSSRAAHDLLSEPLSENEQALAESIERYRSLFAYSPHAAFSLDRHGRFTDANEVTQRLSGYPIEELRLIDFGRLLSPDDIGVAVEAFTRALRGEPQQLEVRMVARDGTRLELRVAAVPMIVGEEVVGVHGVAEDVTENNQLRRDLERARAEAEEANAAKSLFLATMGHEVRTPLTSVLGATELLEGSELDERDRHLVEIIRRSSSRLLRLVNDILDVSGLDAGTLEVRESTFSLRALVEDAVDGARPLATSEELDLGWSVAAGVPDLLEGDGMRIGQVLANLLGNALKFTSAGQVRLHVGLVEDLDLLELEDTFGHLHDDSVAVELRVVDSGIGIPVEQLDGLFLPFTQADPSSTRRYGGAGLGLAICRELVTLMGGTIEARSAAGEGSTFTVVLPLRPAEAVPHPS